MFLCVFVQIFLEIGEMSPFGEAKKGLFLLTLVLAKDKELTHG
jgi:hypothetical protein